MHDAAFKKALVGLLIVFYLPYLHLFGLRYIGRENVDFPTFYAAAKVVFEQRASPYTKTAFADEIALLGERAAPTPTGRLIPPFLYPPPSLPLFYPLIFLSFPAAKLLVLVLNHLCVLPILYIFLCKIFAPDFDKSLRQLVAPLCIIYVLVSFPVVANFEYGQINLIVLLLLGLSWYAVKSDRGPAAIAIPLALAVLMKTYPILLFPVLLMRKKYRAAAWLVGLLAAATIFSYIVLPKDTWHDWLTNVVPTGGYLENTFNLFSPAQARNSSINGFVSRIFTRHQWSETLWPNPALGRLVANLMALIVVGVTVGVSYVASRREKCGRLLDLSLSLFLIMMVLVAPLSWESHLVFVLPAALMAFHLIAAEPRWHFVHFGIVLAFAIIGWLMPLDSPGLTKGLWTLVIPIKFYALVIVWLFFVREVWRFRSSHDTAGPQLAIAEA